MFRHEVSFKLLSEYIDGRCTPEHAAMVASHIKRCASCRKKAAFLKNSAMAMKQLKGETLPDGFDFEFNRRLNEKLNARAGEAAGFSIEDALRRVREILVPPVPVLVRAMPVILIAALSWAILNFGILEEPLIQKISGNVVVYSAHEKKWINASESFKLAKGDKLEVRGDGSFADIGVSKKYRMRLKSGSVIVVAKLLPKYLPGTNIYSVEKGKALVSIEKSFKGSRFIINTPEAKAVAFGTEFMVDVSGGMSAMTKFGVLSGKIGVESLDAAGKALAGRPVTVEGGEATEVYRGNAPTAPRQLLDKEWGEMVEFYQLGEKRRVALLISTGKNRVRELLRPCPIYISDVKPRTIGESLEETVRIIDEAIQKKDQTLHLNGIRRLEMVLQDHPDLKYEPQLLLFIGAYYNYLGMPDEAIATFKKVSGKYEGSTFAGMALYAIGIIYDEKLKDANLAGQYYNMVLEKYSKSPEAQALRQIKRAKVR